MFNDYMEDNESEECTFKPPLNSKSCFCVPILLTTPPPPPPPRPPPSEPQRIREIAKGLLDDIFRKPISALLLNQLLLVEN